jgi:predicted nucleic acid-binding protein
MEGSMFAPMRSTSQVEAALLGALAHAAAALARLDQASAGHTLLPALLHRSRLDAVRRQTATDGLLIDPWHLAALVEGLRPRRMTGARNLAEAGGVFEAGRSALALHRWLTTPDPEEADQVQAARAALEAGAATGVALLDAAGAAWRWLETGGARAPLRAALVQHWVARGLLEAPLPLTGAAALRAEVAWDFDAWIPVFLQALAEEAETNLALLQSLERGWSAARHAVAGHRRHSRTPAAVDLLAALPLLSATSLARALDISIKSACAILDALVRDGIAVEVTGRSARRLFGLQGLAPLATAVAPPRRPVPGRGRGRPRLIPVVAQAAPRPGPIPPFEPLARSAFDYSDLEEALREAEATMRRTRRSLDQLSGGRWKPQPGDTDGQEQDRSEDEGG